MQCDDAIVRCRRQRKLMTMAFENKDDSSTILLRDDGRRDDVQRP
jgi:hypothetical protein